jgi:hypothetical protein
MGARLIDFCGFVDAAIGPNAKFSGAGAKRRAPTAKLLASAATQC